MNRLLPLVIFAASLIAIGQAHSADKTAAVEKDSTVIKSAPAGAEKHVDFNAELGLSFPSLTDLSNRIRIARHRPDPVALAVIATELGVAEKVSGKKASLTAKSLVDEAVELAIVRHDAEELKAVSLLTGKTELKTQIKLAAKFAEEQKAASQSGERSRAYHGRVTVHNHFNKFFDIYVYHNGRHMGTIKSRGNGGPVSFRVNSNGYWRETITARDLTGDKWKVLLPDNGRGHFHIYLQRENRQ